MEVLGSGRVLGSRGLGGSGSGGGVQGLESEWGVQGSGGWGCGVSVQGLGVVHGKDNDKDDDTHVTPCGISGLTPACGLKSPAVMARVTVSNWDARAEVQGAESGGVMTSRLTAYPTPNTRLSMPRLKYSLPKINTHS